MRIGKDIEQWIDQALYSHGLGEPITWDIALMGTQDGPGYFLAMFLPGAALGTMINHAVVISNPGGLNEPTIDEVVQMMIKTLLEERTQQMQGLEGLQITPQLNGDNPDRTIHLIK